MFFSRFALLVSLPLMICLWQGSSCRSSNANANNPLNTNGMTTNSNQNRDLRGLWGGQHISMEVTAEGATINYDCAHGRIAEKIVPDRDGRFEAKGFHTAEHAGPVREDEDNERPAVYRGSIQDQTMTLEVELNQNKEKVGTFTLTHGSGGRLRKCM